MFSLLEVQGVQEVRGRRLQREERGRRIQRLDRSPTHTYSTMFYVTDFSIQKYFIMMNCLLLSHSNHEDTIKEAGFLLETTASAWNLRMFCSLAKLVNFLVIRDLRNSIEEEEEEEEEEEAKWRLKKQEQTRNRSKSEKRYVRQT